MAEKTTSKKINRIHRISDDEGGKIRIYFEHLKFFTKYVEVSEADLRERNGLSDREIMNLINYPFLWQLSIVERNGENQRILLVDKTSVKNPIILMTRPAH